MITKIKNKFFSLYNAVTSSIGFLPSVIALSFLIFSFLLVYFESIGLSQYLRSNTSLWLISDADTSRTVLSTLIGGIISLMVFSFSMVMVLLNQASSNFSPRLLPGLITNKRNQIVLGFYIGTIIFNIIVLLIVLPTNDDQSLKGFSVLIGILLGICCLGMFISFIHGISINIQIDNILNGVYTETKRRLNTLLKRERNNNFNSKNSENWQSVHCHKAGYFNKINIDGLKEQMDVLETNLKVIPTLGKYILPKEEVFLSSKELDEEAQKTLLDFLLFDGKTDPSNDYVQGINQISEVGVRAMSPGVNDPGTALITIDYLTELLAMRMELDDAEFYPSESENYLLELETVNFKEILYSTLVAYRQYCKHDVLLMEKLLQLLQYLNQQPVCTGEYEKVVQEQKELMKMDIEDHITNEKDRKYLYQYL